ncbi:MAG: YqaA family protein [Planctomycetota bacterium]|jgi:membrane protein YqaA with SNARE-associated domain
MNDSLVSKEQTIPLPWWKLHRKLYNWVVHWADTPYGIFALILLALTEPICVPVPADVMVIGMCLGRPKSSIKYGLTCAFFSVLGGTIAFSLGLAIGPERLQQGIEVLAKFIEWLTFGLVQFQDKVGKALELYRKLNVWAIAVSALTPVPYMIFSWVGGAVANVSVLKFIGISLIFRTMRFGGEALLFYFLGERARRLIEKYFNTATVIVIILLALIFYALKQLGHLFTG